MRLSTIALAVIAGIGGGALIIMMDVPLTDATHLNETSSDAALPAGDEDLDDFGAGGYDSTEALPLVKDAGHDPGHDPLMCEE